MGSLPPWAQAQPDIPSGGIARLQPWEEVNVHRRITVDGLACDGCAHQLHGAIEQVDGVEMVDVVRHADAVEFVADESVAVADVHAAIFDAGYTVIG